jgi:hypothetical protein
MSSGGLPSSEPCEVALELSIGQLEARQGPALCRNLGRQFFLEITEMLGRLSMVALTAVTLMILAPAYARRGGGEGG